MKNNQHYIPQNGITIITEVDPAKGVKGLYNLLMSIGNDINTQTVINFTSMKTVHFARWFIIEGAKDASGNQFPDSLAFVTDFDGDIDGHLDEMLSVSGSGFDKVYYYCKGYPEDGASAKKKKIEYFKNHSQKNQLFWSNIRGGTVEQLLGEEELRDAVQKFLTEQKKQGILEHKSAEQIRTLIKEFVAGQPKLSWALQQRAKRTPKMKFNYYGKLAFRLSLLFVLSPILICLFLPIWWGILSRIMEKRDDRNRKPVQRSKEIDELLEREDHIYMNQFTIFATIKKPYWYRLTTLRMGLWLFSTNGVYRANKGKLSGIESIHFARWCIFNNGKNVMFLSNYDGAWQIYLSEFIDRSAAAMNLTFGTTVGYPKVRYLFWGGAFDEQAFKEVVRNNQYPTQVFYSTYPYLTAKNQNNNLKIRQGLDGSSKETAEDWLKRF